MKLRHIFLVIFGLMFIGLQYRLWVGEGSFNHGSILEAEVELARNANESKIQRNKILKAEVKELRQNTDVLEERARQELGLIKEGETFFLVVDENGS